MSNRYSPHLRHRIEPDVSVQVPLDVRLMHMASALLMMGVVVVSVVGGVWCLARLPMFGLQGITVLGDVEHNNEVTLRANVTGRLTGNFFTADLSAVQQAFEGVPWVRKASVSREFPNRLRVVLQEHHPVAIWGSEGELRFVNSYGEVFEVGSEDVDEDKLPRLEGPDSESKQVLSMFQALTPAFDRMGLELRRLELTQRGSWRAHLGRGASIELGRGSVNEVMQRMDRLAATLQEVTRKLGRHVGALESADLRYDNGYALRLQGVSTTNDASGKP